jgi:hypothetical protein
MRSILFVGLLATLAACSQQPQSNSAENQAAAPTDVDVLPPDESVATPSDDLARGTTDASNAAGAENAAEAGAAVENSQ